MIAVELALPIVLGISFIALLFAAFLTWDVLRQDTGTDEMREISDAIKEGANAFLKRQYVTIIGMSFIAAFALYLIFVFIGHPHEAGYATVAFLFGAFSSAIAGFVGMWVAVRTNIRTASAVRSSIGKAIVIALRGGGVTGMIVVALSLIGVTLLYILFGADPTTTPYLIVGYGFGASFVALFAQLGGGIFTKAADMGADLVGKVEAGIPEDDPRNPAVIADLVGDNVGDCAGRGADLFESTAAENIGAMILGVALFPVFGVGGVVFPLVARAFGIIASIIGILSVRGCKEDENPMKPLNRGYLVTALFAAIFFYFAVRWLIWDSAYKTIYFFFAGLVGIGMSWVFVWITEYYTAYGKRPVNSIADSSMTGAATNIVTGLAVAYEATAVPVVVIAIALGSSFWLGSATGVPGGGLYGTAVATMGMLATAAYILAMDTFGPIADNAGGIVEMSKTEKIARERNDKLDAVGNTTKALTKGYAIGSAALAAFLLFSAYIDEVIKFATEKGLANPEMFRVVDLAKMEVFIGALIGAMLIFLFAGVTLRAVNKAAQYIIAEVRRQFKENPDILKGKAKPDYAKCVDICTRGALKEMILPGLLIVVIPTITGVILGAEAMAAFLMVGTIAGILVAILMNTGGAAWDNAKKYIETGVHGGKGTEAHAASVIGDTIGDPFKDTVGPSLHVVIKLLNTLTLVLVPLFLLTL